MKKHIKTLFSLNVMDLQNQSITEISLRES